ncbi:putative cytochrome P450 [Phyllosticta citricarpa]|uniref:Cytochrome P450 n=2 Tax=Phyllosticta TaxID=121621 RepID=A0ABR1MRC5_9PEZI
MEHSLTVGLIPWLLGRRLVLAVVLVLFVTFSLSSYISKSRKCRMYIAQNECKPIRCQYPSKIPILPLDFTWSSIKASREKKYLETLTWRYRTVGNTYSVHTPAKTFIMTIEPENIKTILSLRFNDFSLGERPPIMGPMLGNGIFTLDGKEWSHSRSLLRPNFCKDQVADIQTFEHHVRDLLKLIPRDGSTVDLQKLFFRFTLDSATHFLFGHSVHSLSENSEFDRSFEDAFDYALGEIAIQFRLGPLRGLRRNAKAQNAYKICRDYVGRFVEQAVALKQSPHLKDPEEVEEGAPRNFFLKMLAQATDDKAKIRDELLNILIAGRDTTAGLLSNLFFALARSPDDWQKLREETSSLAGKPPTYEQLRSMKHVKYCLQEALRLWPPIPTNTRLAVRDTVLPRGGGPNGDEPIFVPKGCTVSYAVYAMHRRKDLWGKDAEDFRPGRWEGRRHAWDYLPFNGGPRICLGQQYALTEASYVLIRLVQEFAHLQPRDGLPWTEMVTISLSSANGVKVALTNEDD